MRALSAGYQNHVGKPVEPDELATVIASLTGRLKLEGCELKQLNFFPQSSFSFRISGEV